MKTQYFIPIIILLLIQLSCKTYEAKPYPFPVPVDTSTRLIKMQEKKIYKIDDIYADNEFDGARLNDFNKTEDGVFHARIEAENFPINPSPWYAFRVWSDSAQTIELELDYQKEARGFHRYAPEISRDGKNWVALDTSMIRPSPDSGNAILTLQIDDEKLWVAAQEVINSTRVKTWCEKQAEHPDAIFKSIGKSKLGRDMLHLDISNGENLKKPVIVILSRQHPPEVTGYMAMESFVETLLNDSRLSQDFRKKYRILVFPLMNPDGVDLGHWRHNAGGIDLNRDWGFYRQEEPRTMANYVVKTVRENKSKVVLGLDFHSTYYDVFYTRTPEYQGIKGFKDYWIYGIDEAFPENAQKDEMSPLGAPISASWFVTQFGAEGITYEIGDNTPRNFIRQKGKQAAIDVMQLLIFK